MIHSRARLGGVAWLLLLLLAPGCNSDSPATPTSPTPGASAWIGRWTGTVVGDGGRQGSLVLQIEERRVDEGRSLLLGNWTVQYAEGGRNVAGTISGTLANGAATVDLSPVPRPDCAPGTLPFSLLAGGFTLRLAVSGQQLSGTADAYCCTAAASAPLQLSR